jgi:hypothetical protein
MRYGAASRVPIPNGPFGGPIAKGRGFLSPLGDLSLVTEEGSPQVLREGNVQKCRMQFHDYSDPRGISIDPEGFEKSRGVFFFVPVFNGS